MTDPFANGPRAARPAHMPPVWPPLDPETGLVDLSDDSEPEGFFTDIDIARRMDAATAVAQDLPPAEAMRESNRKLSELTRAQWDFDVRRRAYEDAPALSFTDPGDGREPVFAELSPEQSAELARFAADTGLQVDFPREYGGYFAAVRDPAEDREIGILPRTMVLAFANEVRKAGTTGSAAGPTGSAAVPVDDEGWLDRFMTEERVRDIVLDSLPIIGNYRAGRDALESYGEALEAAERGDWGAFAKHGGLGALNTLGALPLPGAGAAFRIVRIAVRQLADKTRV